jgi:hypothetical protein
MRAAPRWGVLRQFVVQVPPLNAKPIAPLLEVGVGVRHESEA